ncbi:LacI family transcriptional regulator OS=Cellulomonas persica OX=76861 GN=lacI PE=4 SV=1 [Cellulomonas persica]
MTSAGLTVDETLVVNGGFRQDTATQPARDLLDRPDRPTAVFAANDLSAIRTVEVARELGLRVPDDLSVVGFDNVPESALCDPPLTTVSQPLRDIGARALHLLIDLLAERDVPTHLRLPTALIERASCRPLG